MLSKGWRHLISVAMTSLLIGCGFHLQGEVPLAPPLKKLMLKTDDPYGSLSRDLQENLKLSNVQLVEDQENADTILSITQDDASQQLQSVSGTQQTRQYNLIVNVTFNLTDHQGNTLLSDQHLQETRSITVQSDQILGSSNEATLYYQQMRHMIASEIMSRLSSIEVTAIVNQAFQPKPVKAPKPVKKHRHTKKPAA